MQKRQILGFAAALAALSMAGVWAQTTENVTFKAVPAVLTPPIVPSVPAYGETYDVGGSSSDTYMDVQGAGQGSFESFGVIDFTNTNFGFASQGQTVLSIAPTITLTLGDSPYTYTNPGTINFYMTENNADPSTLAYDTSATAAPTGGIGTQLGQLYFLGSLNYTSTPNSSASKDTLTFTLPAALQSYFVQQFNNAADASNGGDPSASTLRFLVAAPTTDPNSPNNAVASFTGAGNVGNEPVIGVTVQVTPEPTQEAVLALGMAGIAGLAIVRRRKNA